MEIIIKNSDHRPLYEQIAAQIRAKILNGELKPGEALPSIRNLARDLKLSVITTKRAYDELEAAGLIDSIAVKGCFVTNTARNQEILIEQRNQELERRVSEIVRLAKDNGVEYETLSDILRICWDEL